MNSPYLKIIIPILLFYFFFAFPDRVLDISITPLGRLISIFIILYYSSVHIYYGIIACLLIIFYYQLDCVEGMAQWNETHILTSYLPQQNPPKNKYIRKEIKNTNKPLFYEKPDKKSVLLEYENNKITDISCCRKTGVCKVNVTKQLDDQEDLVYPKTDENWASQIWNTWFVEDVSNPNAYLGTK